jgi:hypothetical protein
MKFKLYSLLIIGFCILFSVFCSTNTYSQFRPNQVAGLKLWLRSDSLVSLNGSKVSQWNDCSGNGYNATQAIAANQPTLVNPVINNLPAVWYNGSSNYMTGGTISGLDTSSATVFIVASGDSVNASDEFRGLFSIPSHQFCLSWETNPSFQSLSFSNGGPYTNPPNKPLPYSGFPIKVLGVRKMKGVKLEQFFNNILGYSTTSGF